MNFYADVYAMYTLARESLNVLNFHSGKQLPSRKGSELGIHRDISVIAFIIRPVE